MLTHSEREREHKHELQPFPQKHYSDESLHDRVQEAEEGVAPREDVPRIVRRKKSSLGLRDIFLSGGLLPSETTPHA